ncbi:hypothetical protein Trydic_g13301, partial [Trypoxylus dichotomus]
SDGRDWISRVHPGAELWIFGYDPDTRNQSQQCIEVGGERLTKAKISKS